MTIWNKWLIFQRSRGGVVGVGGGGGGYANVNPYLGAVGYGGGNLPYRAGYGGYADIGNQDLTRRQFKLQKQQQQLGNFGYSYDYNGPGYNYDYSSGNNVGFNDYDYSPALNYNNNPYERNVGGLGYNYNALRLGYGGGGGRRGRSLPVTDLIAQEDEAVGSVAVLAPPLETGKECRDSLNPNALLVGAAAVVVGAGALFRVIQQRRGRRGDHPPPHSDTDTYTNILTQAIEKYQSDLTSS